MPTSPSPFAPDKERSRFDRDTAARIDHGLVQLEKARKGPASEAKPFWTCKKLREKFLKYKLPQLKESYREDYKHYLELEPFKAVEDKMVCEIKLGDLERVRNRPHRHRREGPRRDRARARRAHRSRRDRHRGPLRPFGRRMRVAAARARRREGAPRRRVHALFPPSLRRRRRGYRHAGARRAHLRPVAGDEARRGISRPDHRAAVDLARRPATRPKAHRQLVIYDQFIINIGRIRPIIELLRSWIRRGRRRLRSRAIVPRSRLPAGKPRAIHRIPVQPFLG
ncbi:hypothetical protein ACVINW_003942 [Bradyrhizobium sp. USDA 4461]